MVWCFVLGIIRLFLQSLKKMFFVLKDQPLLNIYKKLITYQIYFFKEWDFFTGLIVSTVIQNKEALSGLSSSLPQWVDEERLSQISSFKV